MKFVNNLLKENTQLVDQCLNFGVKIININVLLLNKAMKHILISKGLDPNYEPGNQLKKDLFSIFNVIDKKNYDDDFSWSRLKYNEIADKLDISNKQFLSLTNLSKIKDPAEQKSLLEKPSVNSTKKKPSKRKINK